MVRRDALWLSKKPWEALGIDFARGYSRHASFALSTTFASWAIGKLRIDRRVSVTRRV